jgi:hypothetical protein
VQTAGVNQSLWKNRRRSKFDPVDCESFGFDEVGIMAADSSGFKVVMARSLSIYSALIELKLDWVYSSRIRWRKWEANTRESKNEKSPRFNYGLLICTRL